MNVLVLGAGKMTSALLEGLKGDIDYSDWKIFSPSGSSARELSIRLGATQVSDLSLVKNPEWVLVGCKPQQLKDLKSLMGDQFKDSLFISMLAAVSEKDQMQILGCSKLARIMPNLPVKVRAGVILLSSVSAGEQLAAIEKTFSPLGKICVVSESELEELTLLTGSGPAFFYEFADSLSNLSTSLTAPERQNLARKVLEGAGKMLGSDNEPLSTHISGVTSKAGVTIAVLEKWRELNLGSVLRSGFERGHARAKEIRETLRQK